MANRREMDADTRARDAALFDQLVDIDKEAFRYRNHNVAYHVLSAALHVAHDMADAEKMYLVERLANEQLQWIDANEPEYEHSSEGARQRGQLSVFANLARQAKTMARMVSTKRVLDYMSAARIALLGSREGG